MQEAHYQPKGSLPRVFIDAILMLIHEPLTKEEFIQKKLALARSYGIKHIPSDIELLTYLTSEEFEQAKPLLLTKPVRTGSGVTVIAVMTKPLRCPHGKCTYCPGGPKSFFGDVPQSYTGNEPATMRGMRANYDIYTQIFNRLEQYIISGHNPEKVELILMGGTFPSYDRVYQDEVTHDIYQAMNDFSQLFYENKELNFTAFKTFYELPGSILDKERTTKLQQRIFEQKTTSHRYNKTILELQKENEHAIIRCIGFTIETRPSHAKLKEANIMLEQGCTRVELGVQTTYDDVLVKVHRDHTLQDTKEAIADLKDLGFKINYHVMLGLPLMTPERDIAAAHTMFNDPAFKPDMMKLYPCMVMPGTPLYYDFKAGKYTPYSTAQAADVISEIKRFIPRYTRIMRIQRDIPTKVTTAGVGQTNLRQIVDDTCKIKGVVCQCIRCREVKSKHVEKAILHVEQYEASNGTEFFISYNDPKTDTLLGFCRLRFPGRELRAEITPTTAIIRELHVYGTAIGVGEEGKIQHKGTGRLLMEEAEHKAKEHGKDKMIVISGIGVRAYYELLGYSHDGPYMAKRL